METERYQEPDNFDDQSDFDEPEPLPVNEPVNRPGLTDEPSRRRIPLPSFPSFGRGLSALGGMVTARPVTPIEPPPATPPENVEEWAQPNAEDRDFLFGTDHPLIDTTPGENPSDIVSMSPEDNDFLTGVDMEKITGMNAPTRRTVYRQAPVRRGSRSRRFYPPTIGQPRQY